MSKRFDLAKTVCITGMLAVSYYTVRHGAEFKPYATDALVALLLLVSTVQMYSDDSSKKWWGAFFILIASAPLFSFPLVFVSAGCLCTLLVAAIIARDRARLQLGMSTTAISLAVFTAYYLGHIASHAEANSVLFSYWQDSFAPTNVLEFPMWLVQQLTGRMLAYPIGGDNFGSLLTFLFCVLGIWRLVKIGEYFLVCLLVLPFGFNLIAAVMHLYPFGGSTRIAQHLAPSIVILGGVGLAWIISRGNPENTLKRGHVITFSIMVLLGLAGIAQTLIKPYKSKGALQVRHVVEELVESSRCAPVYVINDKNQVPINFRWYLGIDERAVWKADDELLGRQSGNVCVMSFDADLYPEQRETLKRVLSLPSAKRIEH